LIHQINQFILQLNIRLLNNEVEEGAMGGACSTNGGEEEAYRLLVRKPEGKRPLGRPRRRWVDNIRMDLLEL
jgi:hypothetical protein